MSQLSGTSVGPYRVFAWSSPETPRVGDLHISIAVLDASAAQGALDQWVLDANVQVTLKPLDYAGEAFTKLAVSQETLLGYYYEANFQVPRAGRCAK